MIISQEEAAAILLSAIMAIVAGGAQSIVTEPIVNLIKWVLQKFNIQFSANYILFGVATVVTIITWLSGRIGLDIQSAFSWLATVAPLALALLTTLFGSKAIYNASVARAIPLAGYSRTPEVSDDRGMVTESSYKTYPAGTTHTQATPSPRPAVVDHG